MYQLKVSINQNRPFWTKVPFAADHEPVPICSGPLFSLVKTLRGTGSIYAPPAVAQPLPSDDSKYVKMAREMINVEEIVPRVTAFADKYGLRQDPSKRVLEVGTGYLLRWYASGVAPMAIRSGPTPTSI